MQSSRTKLPFLGLFLLFGLLIAFTQSAYAVDINGSMRNSRAVKVGAAECYRNLANINGNATIKALGRNADGSWVFIWADVGDGWVPTSSTNLQGDVMSLSVWADAFQGEVCAAPPPTGAPQGFRICGTDGNSTAAMTIRWTDIFNTADPATPTGRAYTPNSSVTINGRDFWGCWVQVSGSGDSGWVPVDALNVNTVMALPILVDNSQGCVISGDQISCPQP